jgi:hypothetical protein
MSSIHIARGRDIARNRGGYAGDPTHAELWELPKRELVELVLRLAALAEGDEASLEDGRALECVNREREALKAAGVF